MTSRDLASGVFRAWAIMWCIYFFSSLLHLLNSVFRHGYASSGKEMEAYFVSAEALSLGIQAVVIVFLIRKAGWLATIVFPMDKEVSVAFTRQDFQSILFATVAIFFILDGVRHLAGAVFQLFRLPPSRASGFEYLWQQAPEHLVAAVGGIAGGAAVLFLRHEDGGILARVFNAYQRRFGLRTDRDE